MKIFYTLTAFLLCTLAFAQTEATTKDGKKVILNPDGTWKYAGDKSNPGTNDCSNLTKTETYSGGKVMSSSRDNIKISNNGKNLIEFSIIKGEGSLIMNISRQKGELTCVAKNAKMTVEFTDKTNITIAHMGDLNCKGNFSLFLGELLENEDKLILFKTKKIAKTSIEYSNSVDGKIVVISEENVYTDTEADKIRKTINCLN